MVIAAISLLALKKSALAHGTNLDGQWDYNKSICSDGSLPRQTDGCTATQLSVNGFFFRMSFACSTSPDTIATIDGAVDYDDQKLFTDEKNPKYLANYSVESSGILKVFNPSDTSNVCGSGKWLDVFFN